MEPQGPLQTEVARLVTLAVGAVTAVAGLLALFGVIVPDDAATATGVALEAVASVVIAAGQFIRNRVWSERTVYRIDPAALEKH
jgi:hypothetical protein